MRLIGLADLEWAIKEAGPKFAGEGKGSAGNGEDTSRSAKAFRAGVMLKAAGATYEAMRDALLAHEDPDIAEWARSKGLADGERELKRIFDKANNVEWSEPKPLPSELLPVEPFDPYFLPESIGPWVADIADRMQCPLDFVAVPAMVALGAVLGSFRRP